MKILVLLKQCGRVGKQAGFHGVAEALSQDGLGKLADYQSLGGVAQGMKLGGRDVADAVDCGDGAGDVVVIDVPAEAIFVQ